MINIDYSRDAKLTKFAKETLQDRYMLPQDLSPQDLFARVATAYGDDNEHAQRIYDYISNLWFLPATPILANGGTNRGLPISCFLSETSDNLEGIVDTWVENVWLAARGGGIGTYFGNVRSIGEKVGTVGETSGIIPFIKVVDSITLAISQGSLRRGSAAVYLPIDHPEIEEFLEIRKPTGGDLERKSLNLHHAVVIKDQFMYAVEQDLPWQLKSPKTREVVKTVSARDLWFKILELRLSTGEPFLTFMTSANKARPSFHKDANLIIKTSNLCVSGETKLLTKEGYQEIQVLEGKKIIIWNGFEWSETTIEKTCDEAELLDLTFSNGMTIRCTPYHKFHIQEKNKTVIKTACSLGTKDKLIAFGLPKDIQHGSEEFPHPYTHGLYTAEGFSREGRPAICLCNEKKLLASKIVVKTGSYEENARGELNFYLPDNLLPKFKVPLNSSRETKLEWLAGYFDGDGYLAKTKGYGSFEVSSINLEFLKLVSLLLQTLGVSSKIKVHSEAGTKVFNVRGELKDCQVKAVYRLTINQEGCFLLKNLGIPTNRLEFKNCRMGLRSGYPKPVTVTSIASVPGKHKTFCFTESKRNLGVFNGIIAGNCNEITLPTSNDRTAVCCLSSANLETYHEWEDHPTFVEDVMRFLDNVLSDFIRRAPDSMRRAKHSAERERSVGLGVMGFHGMLQKLGIPFDSVMAKVWNRKIFSRLKHQADMASMKLSAERGPCPDALDFDVPERFSYKLAIAPTASISIIAGASPSIEPWAANVFTQKTLSGSYSVRNPHLQALLAARGYDTEDVWSSIAINEGSVSHLPDYVMSDGEKEVYRTAFEIDQRWIVDLAAERQEFICQGQSLNIFLPPDVHKKYLHDLHVRAWKGGLKGLYYLRSKSLARAEKSSIQNLEYMRNPEAKPNDEECLSCQ